MATAGQRDDRGYYRTTTATFTCTGSRGNPFDDLSAKLNHLRISQREESAPQMTEPIYLAGGSKRSGTSNCPKPDRSVPAGERKRRRRRKRRGDARQKLTHVTVTDSGPLPTLDSRDGPAFAVESQVQGPDNDTQSTIDSVRQDGCEPTRQPDRVESSKGLSSSLASGRSSNVTTLSDTDDNDSFVEPLSEDYHCPICLSVLQEANLTSCCGNHFCKECIERVKDDRQPCPLCKEHSYEIMCDKFFIRKLSDHKVKCPNRVQGCKWVGRLGDQQEHLQFCSGQSTHGKLTGIHQLVRDSYYARGATTIRGKKLQVRPNESCRRSRPIGQGASQQMLRERDAQTHPNGNRITHTSPREQDIFEHEPYFSSFPSSYARERQCEPVSNRFRIEHSGPYSSEIVELLLEIASQNPDIRVARLTDTEAATGAAGAIASGVVVGGRLGYIAGFTGMLSGALLGAAMGGYIYAQSVLESEQSAVDALRRIEKGDPKTLAATALSVAQQLGISIHYSHGQAVLKPSSCYKLHFLIAVLRKLDYRIVNTQ